MNLYKFELEWYNSAENKTEEDCGVIFADNYVNATEKIASHYLDESIKNIILTNVNDICDGVIYIKPEYIESILEYNFY